MLTAGTRIAASTPMDLSKDTENASRQSIEDALLTADGTLGAYIVDRLVGRGGCASVYGARHRESLQRVAIKVMHRELAMLPKMVQRFIREVEVVNLLHHPNIVDIFELGQLPDGRPFYVMEYLSGKSLSAIVKERGRLSLRETLEILEPIGSALETAHQAGIIHRDIKASNIVVIDHDRRPTIKLLDFGIAKLIPQDGNVSNFTTSGNCPGTLFTMSPEQIQGESVDLRADVYALGILLYQMLTGQHPFPSSSVHELVWRHLEEPAPRPSLLAPVPPPVDAVVLRCLEKEPEHRFDSVRSFMEALQDAAGTFSLTARDDAVKKDAAAILVELEVDSNVDEVDTALATDIDVVLDLIDQRLRHEGFLPVLSTCGSVLGVRLLSGDPVASTEELHDAITSARSLRQLLITRRSPDSRLHTHIRVHLDKAIVRLASQPEITGGPILNTAFWPQSCLVTTELHTQTDN